MTSIKDIYWLAGILEGEGYFGFDSSPNIQLTMTDLDVMTKVRKIYKTELSVRINENKLKSNHKDQYNLNICGSLSIQWMMTLYPLMSKRRKEQILNVIKQWSKMIRRQSSSDHCTKGHDLNKNGRVEYTKTGYTIICKICKRERQRLSHLNKAS